MKKILVTGGTGFLGLQIILQALQKGYDVRTTVRKDTGIKRIKAILQANKVDIQKLSFVKADLSSGDNWNQAMADRDYVLSVASPVFFNQPKNEMEAIKPALDGTLRILKAAQANGVKRVVMTSNFGAIGFSKKSGLTTEKDWTDPNERGLSLYEKSKLLAEQAAWKYVEQPDVEVKLTTINPTAIFGPSLDRHVSGSFDLLKNLAVESKRKIPNMLLNVVDVRDVAAIHLLALEHPEAAGQRFIASADGQISMQEIVKLIQTKRPELSQKISARMLPSWLIELLAPFNKAAQEGSLMMHINRNISNQKAKDILHWLPRSSQGNAILAAVDSLVKYDYYK